MEQYLDELSLRIMGILISMPTGLCFTDIVRLVGKPKETVNRRLKVLVHLGIVEKVRHGNKVIYRLSNERRKALKELSIANAIPRLIVLDMVKAIADLYLLGLEDEVAATMCEVGRRYASVTLGALHAGIEELLELALKMLEKERGLSLQELERRLRGVARIMYRSSLDPALVIIPTIVYTVTKLAEQGKRSFLNTEKLLNLCRDEERVNRLYRRAIEVLQKRGKDYAARLAKLEARLNEVDDPWRVAYEVYKDVASEYIENFWRLIEDSYLRQMIRIESSRK